MKIFLWVSGGVALIGGMVALLIHLEVIEPLDDRNSGKLLHYNTGGLEFSYPESWTMSMDEGSDDYRVVVLDDRDDNFCMIDTFGVDDTGESLLQTAREYAVSAGMNGGLIATGESVFEELNAEDGFERVDEKFYVKVVVLKVPMIRSYYRKMIGGRQVTITMQSDLPLNGRVERTIDVIKGSIDVVTAEE